MLYFSDFSTGGGGSSLIAVQDFTLATATGSTSYTTSALGGVTPKGVLLLTGGHDAATPGTESPGARVNIGFMADGSTSCATTSITDNSASTNCSRFTTGGFLRLYEGGGNAPRWIGAGSRVADGISINYSTASANGRSAAFVAFGSAGFSAKAGIVDLGTSAAAVSCTTTFTPDVVIVTSAGTPEASGAFGIVNTDARFLVGIATNHAGTINQRCVALNELDAGAAAGPRMAILTNRIGLRQSSSTGNKLYEINAASFSSTGFTLTASATAFSEYTSWLALSFGGRQYKLVDYTSPTSTGSHSITGVGFRPSFALAVVTNLEATDPTFPVTTSDLMSGLSICLIGDEQHAFSMRNDSGADPTDCASLMKNVALLGANATNCAAIEATLTSFDSDGMTLNYSAVQGTGKKGFILFVE